MEQLVGQPGNRGFHAGYIFRLLKNRFDDVLRYLFRSRAYQHRIPLRRLVVGGSMVVLIATIVTFFGVERIKQGLPDVAKLKSGHLHPGITILSSDGVVLATLESRRNRPVALANISPWLVRGTVDTEDIRFYAHKGVDWRGVLRALGANLWGGNLHGQGGSTITQQLARNLYLSNTKSFRRKISEILLAQKIEQSHSKAEILEAYLNTVYYGSGNYGVEAAARSYFGKSAHDLTLGEAALLAGIPQRPTAYALPGHLDAALERRKSVLACMRRAGDITPQQERLALIERPVVRVSLPMDSRNWRAPYFVADVLGALHRTLGTEGFSGLLGSGGTVETTLDWTMQQAAERLLARAVRKGQRSASVPNTGAIVCIDPLNGGVRTLVGGSDFKRDQFDAVTQGVRQPGSAFKPVVYATAFDMGICDLGSVFHDTRSRFPMGTGGGEYEVHNYDGRYRGDVSVLDAIRESVNTVAVQVCQGTGPANVGLYARRLGLTTSFEPTLPLALGASGVRPIELCAAYAVFASGGTRYDPTMITQVTDAEGRPIYRDDRLKRKEVVQLKASTIAQLNVALREAVVNGTGGAAKDVPDAHGKTGTTSSHRDTWFVGYTGELVTAVWLAHAGSEVRNGVRMVRYSPMGTATGGDLCAPLWADFMQRALPEQRRVNRSHGIGIVRVSEPDKSVLLATLQEARQLVALGNSINDTNASANTQGSENENARTEDTKRDRYPPGFEPAENGSGPIIVDSDVDNESVRTNDSN